MVNPDDLSEALKMMSEETGSSLGEAMKVIINDMSTNNTLPRDAIGIDSTTVEGLYAQAYHHYNSGRYKDAARLFVSLQLLDGMEPKYPLGLGACYQMLEEYQNAIITYSTVAISDPENPVPHYHASDCYVKQGLIPAAIAELQMTIELCGDQPQYAMMRDRARLTIKSLKEKGQSLDGAAPPSVEAPTTES
jgi:type III secretion system low calcium response chaperone LcrH/SycD